MMNRISITTRAFPLALRLLLAIAAFGLTGETARAQFLPYLESLMADSSRSFDEVQKAASAYWEEHPDLIGKKGSGYKQYKRWEWFWEQRAYGTGKLPGRRVVWDAWESFVEKNGAVLASSEGLGGEWSPVGPYDLPTRTAKGLGRLNCIAFHPTDENTFWVGAPAGGLWKTTDFGTTWTSSSDNLPVLGVSDIAIDPTNPDIMYIATGDGDLGSLSGIQSDLPFRAGDTRSIGVLKTTNGGMTWEPTGLLFEQADQILIRRLLMDPSDRFTLIAASSVGLLRTNDGGFTWSIVAPGYFIDLEYHPTNPDIVYATTYSQGQDDPTVFYRSGDGGLSWIATAANLGVKRAKIGVTPDRPNRVDILCASQAGGLYGIFSSADAGFTFNPGGYVPDSIVGRPNLLGWYEGTTAEKDFFGGQGFYDLAYAISPTNPYEIYVGGVNTWRTSDGGANWKVANFWSPFPSDRPYNSRIDLAHADKHFLKFHPLRPDYLFECNDGGLWYTSDRGNTWHSLTDGLQIGQIYRLSVSQQESNTLLAGHQDNGTWMYDRGVWRKAGYGDGMEVAVDPSTPDVMYRLGPNGTIWRSFNRLREFEIEESIDDNALNEMFISSNIPGYGRDFQGEWVTPFVIDPVNHSTIYVGMLNVWKSDDRGDSWQPISPISVSGERVDEFGNPVQLGIRALAVSPADPDVIFASTFEDISATVDGGENWSVVGFRFSNAVAVTNLAPHPSRPNLCFVTLSGYVDGSKVFVIDLQDPVNSPINISRNLPNLPVNCAVYDERNGGGLYVGTDVGVFYLNLANPNALWQPFNDGLPRVPITDLDIHEGDDLLYAATFGRGVWQSDLLVLTSDTPEEEVAEIGTKVRRLSADGLFEISLADGGRDEGVVYSYLGAKLTSVEVTSDRAEIDLRAQPTGVYYLALKSEGFGTLHPLVVEK